MDDHPHAAAPTQRASRFSTSQSPFRQPPLRSVSTRDQFRFTQRGYDEVEDDEAIEFDSFGMLTRVFRLCERGLLTEE
jgi:hypothetical protein